MRRDIPLIKELPITEQPQQRLRDYGTAALSITELIACLLQTPSLFQAQELMRRFGLQGLLKASIPELCQVTGIGPARAVQLKAAFELGRRSSSGRPDLIQIVLLIQDEDPPAIIDTFDFIISQLGTDGRHLYFGEYTWTDLFQRRLRVHHAILRWIEVTQQLDEIGIQLGRIKEQYGEIQYPDEIESLAALEPIDRRKRELGARENDLRSRSCRLGNEQARLDEQIRATLPINVWYRVDGHRLRWISEPHATPRLVYEEVRELERAA